MKNSAILPVSLLLTLFFWLPVSAATGDLDLRAHLVWASDGAKPKDERLTELDATIKKKLKSVFKWKEYYQVDRQDLTVSAASKKRVRMSAKCEVEVQNLGDSMVEVHLYGEGRLVVKKKQTLKSGELLVLAGDDKNDSAWFVVLTPRK